MSCKELVDEYKDQDEKVAYSGRLDPLAHGMVTLLFGEQCKLADIYNKRDKTYIFQLIPGVSTDTFDIMGMVTSYNPVTINPQIICDTFDTIKNNEYQKIPWHSSLVPKERDENGQRHPLWWWALHSRTSEIEQPISKKKLYSIELETVDTITSDVFFDSIVSRINKVNSKFTFRQQEILEKWSSVQFLGTQKGEKQRNDTLLQVFTLKAHVSSGFYIRQLVNDIGEIIGIPCLTNDIYRPSI